MFKHLPTSDATFGDATFRFWQNAHSRFASKSSNMEVRSKDESGKMEVDLVVTPKPQRIELEVIFGTKNFSYVVDGSSKAKGATLVPVVAPIKVIAHSNGTADPTLFDMTVKDEHANFTTPKCILVHFKFH